MFTRGFATTIALLAVAGMSASADAMHPQSGTCPTCPSSAPMTCPMPSCPPMCSVNSSCVLCLPLPFLGCKYQCMDPCTLKRCKALKGETTGDLCPTLCHLRAACHGYYYFRPYNYAHVLMHSAKAASWGGDYHRPYARGIIPGDAVAQTEDQLKLPPYDGDEAVQEATPADHFQAIRKSY